jgi:outer membrane protein assembly factor BamB
MQIRAFLWIASALLISACTSAPRRQPTNLPELPPLSQRVPFEIQGRWLVGGALTDFAQLGQAHGASAPVNVAIASRDGMVSVYNPLNGQVQWQQATHQTLSTGTGFDGQRAAVITTLPELWVLHSQGLAWKTTLPLPSYTAPWIGAGRVFVLLADHSVLAFDGASGRPLWASPGTEAPLLLAHPGVLLAVGNTLVVSVGSHLKGLDPTNGHTQFDLNLATPKGSNEIERLAALVGPAARQGHHVCVRAFQHNISCVDVTTHQIVWSKTARGFEGLDGDEDLLISVEDDGKVIAWDRRQGQRVWANTSLRFHGLHTPLLTPQAVLVGDNQGYLHVLSRHDGRVLNRFNVDASPLPYSPVQIHPHGPVLVMTKAGTLLRFSLGQAATP